MRILILILTFFIYACEQNEIPQFNGKQSFDFLLKQCEFGPRNPGSIGHLKFSKYLEEFLNDIDNEIIVQNFVYEEHITSKMQNGKNFVIQFNKESHERLLIGAHWDTRSISDEENELDKRELPVLGANDGASGTAVLMELALVFRDNPPPIGIDLVFFDAEDVGISGQPTTFAMGSEYFSKNLPIKKPQNAIIVDMVGDKNLKIPIERFSYKTNPDLVKELWNLAEELDLEAFKYTLGYEIYDDHVPLWVNAQIPAIDIIDFDYPNLFYNYWHTQNDIVENCSPQSLQQVGTLLLNYIYD
ncbi:MAG: hypothetical protein CBB74_00015 [Owenweeksia sp. TMED14]|mgnify:FL=1|nr:MAG: hypothetical protein CBB74_00015 [Owenweeksia sp. TMED14]|tara:strand:- start:1485 stop:2387 length:903 start_codon:yes stop_codon:yes gene_type:complete